MRAPWALVWLAGCGASGNAASQWIESRAPEAVAQGARVVGASSLDGLPGTQGPTEAHHDVARARLDDGSLLFVQSDASGLVALVLRFESEGQSADVAAVGPYQTAWNIRDPMQRAALLASSWGEAARYVDPGVDVTGRQELSGAIEAYLASAGTTMIAPSTPVQVLPGGYLTFGWRISSSPPRDGFDVGQLDEGGRLSWIAGFFSPR